MLSRQRLSTMNKKTNRAELPRLHTVRFAFIIQLGGLNDENTFDVFTKFRKETLCYVTYYYTHLREKYNTDNLQIVI